MYKIFDKKNEVSIRALIFFDDISGDLLGIDTFANTNLTDSFEKVSSVEDLKSKLLTALSSLASIESKYNLDQVYKFSFVAVTLKYNDEEINLILMPTIITESNKNQKSDNLTDFIDLMKYRNDHEHRLDIKEICKNSEGLSYIYECLPGSNLVFFLYLGTDPKIYHQISPLLENMNNLRLSLIKDNIRDEDNALNDGEEIEGLGLRNYSKNLISDITFFIKEVNPLLVSNFFTQ